MTNNLLHFSVQALSSHSVSSRVKHLALNRHIHRKAGIFEAPKSWAIHQAVVMTPILWCQSSLQVEDSHLLRWFDS